jgi:hypothetical protein
VEAGGSPSEGLGAELDRIEAAVDAGDTGLGRLGFWRVVGLIKRDDELIDRYAEQVGRIDAKGFDARFPHSVPLWLGNALLVASIAVGVVAAWAAVLFAIDTSSETRTAVGVALVVAALAWVVGLHSFTHYVVGRLVGIRFRRYFFEFPPPPLPGLKTDYATYLRATPTGRAWMHASGAIATKLAPFLALALAPATGAPGWSVVVLLALGLFQIVTDVLFSTKASDWKKVRRELEIGRSRRRISV